MRERGMAGWSHGTALRRSPGRRGRRAGIADRAGPRPRSRAAVAGGGARGRAGGRPSRRARGRRGGHALRGRDRRRGRGVRGRQAPAGLLRAPGRPRLARARAHDRARGGPRPARHRRRQAWGHRGHRDRLRAGLPRRHGNAVRRDRGARRRRDDGEPVSRLRHAATADRRGARGRPRRGRARAYVEPRRRRVAGPRAGRRRAHVGTRRAARRRARRRGARAGVRPGGRRRRHRRDGARAPRAAARAHARHAVPPARGRGSGRPGRGSGAGVRARARGGAGHRLARDRARPRVAGWRTRRRRARRGSAAARARLAACRLGRTYPGHPHACLEFSALAGPGRARRRGRGVDRGPLGGGRRLRRRRRLDGDDDGGDAHDPHRYAADDDDVCSGDHAAHLRRPGGRRSLGDRGEDRRPARADRVAQPRRRRPVAARRPEDQARPVTRAVSTALVAVLAAIALVAPASAAPPAISARTAFLVQPDTRDVIYARAPGRQRPMASTAKLMTALLTLEHRKLTDKVSAAPYSAAPAESVAGLRAGERMTVADLLRALLLASANDAAATLAVDVAGSKGTFVAMMNRRARQLGLKATHYSNPIGLDAPDGYSSARDLVELALVLRRNPFFRQTVDRPRAVLRSGSHRRVVVNRNDLVGRVPYVDGVKSGHTLTAGYVLVGSARRNGVGGLSAGMGEPSLGMRDADTPALLRYGLSRYRRVTAIAPRARLANLSINDQGDAHVAVVAARPARVVARRGERLSVRLVAVPDDVTGPLDAGSRVGTAEVLRRGKPVARVPLVTATAVAKATVGQRVRGWLGSTATIVLLVALVACTVQLLLLRRRVARRRRRSAGEPEAT